ncbi:MAG TPA: hypothetical protein VF915_10990, partial [Reyranella sp.]
PAALQLRTLQTLVEVSAERNNTIIFPIPIELLPRAGSTASPAVASLVSGAAAALAASKARSGEQEQLPPAETERAEKSEFEKMQEQFDAMAEVVKRGG